MNTRRTISSLAAAVMAGLMMFTGARPALAQGGGGSPRLEGTWVVLVRLVNPPPGFPLSFTALETYSRGGGMVTSNNLPAVPRPGQGQWEKGQGDQYNVAIRFFLFDETGAPAGAIKVTHRIELQGKDGYEGEGRADFFDTTGTLFLSVPFRSRGERLQVE